MNNPCESMQDRIVDSLLGNLNPQESAALHDHIRGCSECAKYHKALQSQTGSLLQFSETLEADMPARYNRVIKALHQSESIAATPLISIGRAIRRSRITKPSVAAVIVIAILMGISMFDKSPNAANIAWGEVKENFMAQSWVHVKYDNGREEWMNIREGRHFYISEFGWRFFVDWPANTRLEYSHNGDYILQVAPHDYPDGKIPPWDTKFAWDVILGCLDDKEDKQLGRYIHIDRHLDTVEDHDRVRFDVYYLDALDTKVLTTQIWVDPQSRLPVLIQRKLPRALRETQEQEYIIGEYDFPNTGPASIYDIGAPRELEIVKRTESSLEARQIIQEAENALNNFPKYYRAMVWHEQDDGEIDLLYRNDEKLHFYHYFNLEKEKYPQSHLVLPATSEQILTWTQTQIPIEVGVFDGARVFRRLNSHPFVNIREQTVVRVKRASASGPVPRWFNLENHFWPYLYDQKRSWKIIPDHPENPPGCITLSDGSTCYFVDPYKDYLAVKTISIIEENQSQHRIRDQWLSHFTQLPTGHWYPQKTHAIRYASSKMSGPPPGIISRSVHIDLLTEKEFPPDIFDGETLLEDARLETY